MAAMWVQGLHPGRQDLVPLLQEGATDKLMIHKYDIDGSRGRHECPSIALLLGELEYSAKFTHWGTPELIS
jgi:hypothetical protein